MQFYSNGENTMQKTHSKCVRCINSDVSLIIDFLSLKVTFCREYITYDQKP